MLNVEYGLDDLRARSAGGHDGIFVVTRDYRPANAMMRKLFERFLDDPASGAPEVAAALGCRLADLLAVRVVSHHLRLLGVLCRGEDADWLVLIDVDER